MAAAARSVLDSTIMSSFIHGIQLFISLLIVASLNRADTGSPDSENLVIIGPVENITAYITGSTNIVLTWDPPPVYLVHDVANASLDQVPEDQLLLVSKHQSAAIDGFISAALNSSNHEEASVVANQKNSTENVSDTSAATGSPDPINIIKCRPISFFSNYSVAMKQDPDVSDQSMAIAFKGSIEEHRLQNIKVTDNQKAVNFSEGCITNYVVSWGKVDPNSTVFNMSVPSTSSMANITGLTPDTRYRVKVTAVYVSGDSIDNKPEVIFTTKKMGELEECHCDMFGAVSLSLGCNTTGSTYCSCKLGYQGKFCETCAPGYYRTAPHFPCHRCPCDVHPRRKTGCKFVEGFLECESCEVGYAGKLCHDCTKGFYRRNLHCAPCFCNGNGLSTADYSMCAAPAGNCLNCQYNTTGFNCERCMPGYDGDPITYKNCTLLEEIRARNMKMASSMSTGVVATIVVIFLLVILLVAAILLFRRYHSKERLRAFWTIEMKKDRDDVDFSSVHNDEARLDDVGNVDFFSKHNTSSSSGKYSRLHEDI